MTMISRMSEQADAGRAAPAAGAIRGLSAEELAMTAEDYFASFPWDSAHLRDVALDPDSVSAADFLGSL